MLLRFKFYIIYSNFPFFIEMLCMCHMCVTVSFNNETMYVSIIISLILLCEPRLALPPLVSDKTCP